MEERFTPSEYLVACCTLSFEQASDYDRASGQLLEPVLILAYPLLCMNLKEYKNICSNFLGCLPTVSSR